MSKTLRTIATAICALFLLPLSAQEKGDTVYTFRFVSDRDMFYVPYSGNDTELARLEECIGNHRTDILSGETPLYVDGYSTAGQDETENLAMAKIRSNRVKSELIVRQKLTEECFITKNHSGGGDYVTVRIVIPAGKDEAEEARLAAERAEQERIAAEQAERQRLAAEKAEAERIAREREQARLVPKHRPKPKGSQPRNRKPSIPIHCPSVPTCCAGLPSLPTSASSGASARPWASWSTARGPRGHGMTTPAAMPSGKWLLRCAGISWYLGEKKAWYVGAMFKAGQFNYKFSGTGRQGDLMGGGITGGYQLRLTGALSMDFSLGQIF